MSAVELADKVAKLAVCGLESLRLLLVAVSWMSAVELADAVKSETVILELNSPLAGVVLFAETSELLLRTEFVLSTTELIYCLVLNSLVAAWAVVLLPK